MVQRKSLSPTRVIELPLEMLALSNECVWVMKCLLVGPQTVRGKGRGEELSDEMSYTVTINYLRKGRKGVGEWWCVSVNSSSCPSISLSVSQLTASSHQLVKSLNCPSVNQVVKQSQFISPCLQSGLAKSATSSKMSKTSPNYRNGIKRGWDNSMRKNVVKRNLAHQ